MVCALSLVTGTAFAASNNCDDTDKYNFINQNLALCSTHAYNVGAITNPETYSDREVMNEVVALKTTIMTQQMKKQYDYLETTIKRFKTQLERAILTTQMQAAGAAGGAADGYGSGGYNATRSTVMGEDCTGKNRTDTVYCLRQNYIKMRSAVDARNYTNDLKEQIVRDTKALNWIDSKLMVDTTADGKTSLSQCSNKNYLTQNTIPDCLGKISGATNALEEGGKSQSAGGLSALMGNSRY